MALPGHDLAVSTAENYRAFAGGARGRSPQYEELAIGVAGDQGVLAFLATLRVLASTRLQELSRTMPARRTQTNEPARCATLLPAFAALPPPLALIEVGASAGLTPLPAAVPDVVWRAGLDLNPLDVTSDDDVRWLECLIWPGAAGRLERLRAAVETARRDPPPLRQGDLLTDLPDLVRQAPAGATVVVFHSAVLAYVSRAVIAVTDSHGTWVEWIA